MNKHRGGGNRQNRSTKTLTETKNEDKEEGRDCSQQKGRRGIQRYRRKCSLRGNSTAN
ncbi:hypothetical protein NC651_021240 [Populus alba x Populus x berolinensis]|nr:hypothetical protein NC651_021240 [Populus alba x Populus x berolinensis]